MERFQSPLLTQRDVVILTGAKPETLQNWAKRGLIRPAEAPGGKGKARRYELVEVIKIQFLAELGSLGLDPGRASALFQKVEPLVRALAAPPKSAEAEAYPAALAGPERVYRIWMISRGYPTPKIVEFLCDADQRPLLPTGNRIPVLAIWFAVDLVINGWVLDALRFIQAGRPSEEAWLDIQLGPDPLRIEEG